MNKYLDKVSASTALLVDYKPPDGLCTLYFEHPYLVLSNFVQRTIRTIAKRYCKNLKIKLVFSSFKVKNLMNVKDSVPRSFRSKAVYKCICTECNSAYFGETTRYLSTRVREHLFTDKSSSIFKHLRSSN